MTVSKKTRDAAETQRETIIIIVVIIIFIIIIAVVVDVITGVMIICKLHDSTHEVFVT